jgi:hypothetical protein
MTSLTEQTDKARDVDYLKFAGEKTATQSSSEGSGFTRFTVTHSVSLPCNHMMIWRKTHIKDLTQQRLKYDEHKKLNLTNLDIPR